MLEALSGHNPLIKIELAFGIISEYSEFIHTNGQKSKEYHDAITCLANEIFFEGLKEINRSPSDK